ncbi:MAG: hypothetical protein V8S89_02340 [Oscillospiraceae bacterium]
MDYLKQLGGETDNLSFGAEGLPFTVAEEKRIQPPGKARRIAKCSW